MAEQSQEQQSADAGKGAVSKAAPPAPPRQDPPAQSGEESYTVAGWKSRARMGMGVSPHAVAGALAGKDPEDTFTEGQVRKALDSYDGQQGVEGEQAPDDGQEQEA